MENVQKLRRKARERDKVQRFTFVFDEGPEPMLICSVIVPDSEARFVGEHLSACVTERVEEHGMRRVLGLGHVVSSSRPYDALAVVEKTWRTADG